MSGANAVRKVAPILAVVITVLALVVVGVWWHHAIDEARWSALEAQVPGTPLSTTQTSELAGNVWLFGSAAGDYEVGHVVLGDGKVWRFAFASHHHFRGPDSYTVFKGQQGTIRVRGGGFCCEVEFGEERQPTDTHGFIALLRSRGDGVEILNGR